MELHVPLTFKQEKGSFTTMAWPSSFIVMIEQMFSQLQMGNLDL
jgi:hypothetical protein